MASDVLDVRRGLPVYERNPSVAAGVPTRKRPVKVTNGNKVMIVGKATGELLGEGHAAFFEEVEVDREQFVKIYLAGVQKTTDLSTSGMKVFGIVLAQLRESPQGDRVEMNPYLGKKYGVDISARTFRRGLRELLDHEFLFCSRPPASTS
jgi:hypothetical protein